MASSSKLRRLGAVLVLAMLVPTALVAACSSSNDNPQPAAPVYSLGDTGAPAPGADSGTGVVQADDASSHADAPLTQLDGALVQDAASCTTDAGCWSCTPITNPEFLNQCTSSQCSPFSNTTRLPDWDGGLPPIN
jgi:hypothetical protein